MTVYRNMCVVRIIGEETCFQKRTCESLDERYFYIRIYIYIYIYIYVSGESRIVFSNVTTEATKLALLIQVELVDKFFVDQDMRKISLPFTVEGYVSQDDERYLYLEDAYFSFFSA